MYYIINYKTLRFSKQNRPEIIHYIKIKLIESHIAADFFQTRRKFFYKHQGNIPKQRSQIRLKQDLFLDFYKIYLLV